MPHPCDSVIERLDGSFVSLFSGAGGLDLGFIQAGFTPVWANDLDADSVETYNGLMSMFAPRHRATAEDVAIAIQRLGRGDAEIVIGGPPCQGFSVAGKMDADDPRSRHVWTFFDVVKRVEPRAFVMENVLGLALNRRWADLRRHLLNVAQNELGYATRLITLRASDYGVPQNRDRMFLIGIRGGAPAEPATVSTNSPPTVRQALAALPPYGDPGNDTFCVARVTAARRPVLRRSPYAGMLFNGKGRPLDLDRPASTLPASMGGNRTPIIDQRHLEGEADSWVVDYHERLMRGKEPVNDVPVFLRRLTVEEAATLQTFPRAMHWHGRTGSKFRQIGNAVPPLLALQVALAVRRSLDEAPGLASIAPLDEPALALTA